ncbi:ABC transporter ATP-binding protein [Thermocladium modestius]|uniref:ABC transporter ATP-binding protein n=1 Tax=Thermocladium modestius TaxID=62609 RepID=A0A830GXD9_9CREN|nr:ABC transporter ATP-binding protein [Thermocladium modestius]
MVNVVAKGITKIYKSRKKEVVALDNVSIDIRSGESFGILGPSGAGKTTFMRIIAGLDIPTRGELYFNDELVAVSGKLVVPPEDRNIGMVFQTWALYPNMTAYDNIAFPLRSLRMNKDEERKRINEVSDILGIAHVLNHYPRELSGGQQQRVALARALVKNPSILLLDEPFSNLDARIRDSARALVRRIQNELKITTITVSHDPADIFSIAERAGVIVHGKLVQVDKPSAIYSNPVTVEVARLIGDLVELSGRVEERNNKVYAVVDDFTFPISKVTAGDVRLGIRLEDLKISDEASLGDEWVLVGKARVKVSSYSSGLFRVTVVPPSNDNTEIVAMMDRPFDVGKEVNLFVRSGKVLVFS